MDRQDIVKTFTTLINAYLDGVDKALIIDDLINRIDPGELYEIDDLEITDCYFAIKHLTEDKYETTPKELKYFLECFNGERKYNLEEKNKLI
jgi:hypothetical protein